MHYLIATTFEVVHYIALQAVHYKPLQEVHLSRYNQKNYSEIRKFRDNYDFEYLISNAKIRLQTFLGCDQLDASVKWRPVYFFFLSQDGKELDNAIVIDLNLIYKMTEEERINFLAHEFFHVYRAHFEHHEFNYANDINFVIDI